MNSDSMRELLNQQPFQPFEIFMSSGERHAVKHPEFVMVSPSRIVVMDPVTDRLAILSTIHVAEVRMLHAERSPA